MSKPDEPVSKSSKSQSDSARPKQSPLVWGLSVTCLALLLTLGWVLFAPQKERGISPGPSTAQMILAAAKSDEGGDEASVTVATKEAVPVSPEDIVARVKRSVVLVEVEFADGMGSGTGFPIDENRVATCAHVVADATKITVITQDGTQVDATVRDTDPQNDIAILDCGDGLPEPLELGDAEKAREGEDIAVTGFPVMDKLASLGYIPVASTSRGSISAVRRRRTEAGESTELQTDAPINPGNSGGPVYSLKTGKVVGLASSRLVEESGIGFAVPVNALAVLAGPLTNKSATQTAGKAAHDAALFAVDDKGSLDTVLLLKRGKYVWPTHPTLDGETTASVAFDANYFRPGKKFTVVFGGAEAGTAEVIKGAEPSAGITFKATVALQTSAPITGRLQALATDAPQLVGPASTRRSPTDPERAAALEIATRLFTSKGVPVTATAKVSVLNLTAGDLNGDGAHELMGSFLVLRNGCKQNLFAVLEPDGAGGFKAAVSEFYPSKDEFGVDAEEQRLLDWIDLDQDGTAELVTISHFYEWWEYKAYSRSGGKWKKLFHGHGGGA